MRYLLSFWFLTVGTAYAANPQSTLSLPPSTLAAPCRCPNGGPCVCNSSTGCPCGANCVHGNACPGKRQEGVAVDHADAVQAAQRYGCGLVSFVGIPARPIRGAVGYHLEVVTGGPRVWAGTVFGGRWLNADATDSEIMTACHPGQVVVGHEKVCDDAGCKLLPIFGDPPPVYTNAALMAPPMYAMQYGGSFGGQYGGGGCASGHCR
jgi:hypothetical protein